MSVSMGDQKQQPLGVLDLQDRTRDQGTWHLRASQWLVSATFELAVLLLFALSLDLLLGSNSRLGAGAAPILER